MKTAISVEDSLMEQADDAARDLGLTRSGLMAQALRYFLRERRGIQITGQLNRAYSKVPNRQEKRVVRKLKSQIAIPDRW